MPGNADAWELLQAGATQLRVAGMGGTIGFDYVALALVAESLGIDTSPAIWRKVRAVEMVIRQNEAKRLDAEQARNIAKRKH